MKNILGVILCGGESKRMGSDKGLMPIQNSIWAKFMADKLLFLEGATVFSVNELQLKNYSSFIAPDDLVVDDYEIGGPARGLLSVNRKFRDKDILLVSCDMLDLDEFTIRNILQVYLQEKDYDYYVYQDEKYAQPFCGIYTGKGLGKLRDLIRLQALSSISMQYILNNGLTKRIAIEHKDAFHNFNYKDGRL